MSHAPGKVFMESDGTTRMRVLRCHVLSKGGKTCITKTKSDECAGPPRPPRPWPRFCPLRRGKPLQHLLQQVTRTSPPSTPSGRVVPPRTTREAAGEVPGSRASKPRPAAPSALPAAELSLSEDFSRVPNALSVSRSGFGFFPFDLPSRF